MSDCHWDFFTCESPTKCKAAGTCWKKESEYTMPPLPKCRWCGGAPHAGEWCPLVAAIEYHQSPVDAWGTEWPERTVKRVEFHPPMPAQERYNPFTARMPGCGCPIWECANLTICGRKIT